MPIGLDPLDHFWLWGLLYCCRTERHARTWVFRAMSPKVDNSHFPLILALETDEDDSDAMKSGAFQRSFLVSPYGSCSIHFDVFL